MNRKYSLQGIIGCILFGIGEQKVGQLIDDVTFRELMQGFDLQNADLEREYTELERLDSDYLSYLRSVDGFVNYIARYTQAVTTLRRP